MKFTSIALSAAAAGVAIANPHHHQHRHVHHNKARDIVTETDTATMTIMELNGTPIPLNEACNRVQAGELKFKDPDNWLACSTSSSSAAASSSSSSESEPSSTAAWSSTSEAPTAAAASSAGAFYEASTSSESSSTPSAQPSSSPPAAEPPASSSSSSSTPSVDTSAKGIDSDFPDGQLSCDTFPSDYGALAVNYLGMKGWSGLQAVTIAAGFVNHIVTGISGEACREGMMCSYACPPGYQKSQWPSTQGLTGQSVGGLSCSGGKLRLTNKGLSSKLCIPGVGGVQATNNAGGVVAICRTDYPGTESETVPTELQPGSTQPLTVPDAATYYTWQGKSTSAQYYLNPIGYGASDACQWGSPGKPLGNYAPINFGIGAKDGKTWLSIFQNAPTTDAKYQGKVEIQGNLSGTCKYENGQYCGVTGCNSNGCTVAVLSGTATYVISN